MKQKKEDNNCFKISYKCEYCGVKLVDQLPILKGTIVLPERRCLCSPLLPVMTRQVVGLGSLIKDK
jgi:hypothetical protein